MLDHCCFTFMVVCLWKLILISSQHDHLWLIGFCIIMIKNGFGTCYYMWNIITSLYCHVVYRCKFLYWFYHIKANFLIEVDMGKIKIYNNTSPVIKDKLQIIIDFLVFVIRRFWINPIQKLASTCHQNKEHYQLTNT